VAVAASLVACGGSSPSSGETPGGSYPVEVTDASFPRVQRLGQTSLLRLGMRNGGEETIPALIVTIGIEGRQGRDSSLPFGIRDPQPELASPDRPVWVLAETYPRFAGSSQPGGATTVNPKTFDFGPLDPGETTEAVWKLSAVKAGRYKLRYEVGGEPAGSFTARITPALPETEVNDRGEVVKIKRSQRP
jgi:hypothetical protein